MFIIAFFIAFIIFYGIIKLKLRYTLKKEVLWNQFMHFY